mmetsp:Transcript_58532/g.94594  ORF Transcript_58532/g.94594 Transcript_58532/m.94594 type:complete len:123 (+) Transcript_58532:954-1322(+)
MCFLCVSKKLCICFVFNVNQQDRCWHNRTFSGRCWVVQWICSLVLPSLFSCKVCVVSIPFAEVQLSGASRMDNCLSAQISPAGTGAERVHSNAGAKGCRIAGPSTVYQLNTSFQINANGKYH